MNNHIENDALSAFARKNVKVIKFDECQGNNREK